MGAKMMKTMLKVAFQPTLPYSRTMHFFTALKSFTHVWLCTVQSNVVKVGVQLSRLSVQAPGAVHNTH